MGQFMDSWEVITGSPAQRDSHLLVLWQEQGQFNWIQIIQSKKKKRQRKVKASKCFSNGLEVGPGLGTVKESWKSSNKV